MSFDWNPHSRSSHIGQSLITVVSHHNGLSSQWSLITVVSQHSGLSSQWSVITVVSHHRGLSAQWSLICSSHQLSTYLVILYFAMLDTHWAPALLCHTLMYQFSVMRNKAPRKPHESSIYLWFMIFWICNSKMS